MPLISVIVPVYKVEPYLHQCVDSILNQTFKDFELILVDDGSPDNCPAICDEYAKKDNRVIVIHKENGGLSSARNAGLDYVFANSDSEYISFIDSDDYVSNRFLQELLTAVDGVDMVVCDICHFDENGIKINDYCLHNEVLDSNNYWQVSHSGSDVFQVVSWNKLYSKKIFETIRFPVGKIHEDAWVIPHIVGECKRISIIEEVLYFYRIRNNSIMSSIDRESLEEIQNLLDLYTSQMLFFTKINNNEMSIKSFNSCFSLLSKHYFENKKNLYSSYLILKKYYFEHKRKICKPIINETLFLLFPSVYCFFRKILKRNLCVNKN